MPITVDTLLSVPMRDVVINKLRRESYVHNYQPEKVVLHFAHLVGEPLWFTEQDLAEVILALNLSGSEVGSALTGLVAAKRIQQGKFGISPVFRLVALSKEMYERELSGTERVIEPQTQIVLPMSVVENTRGYLESVIRQANGCYENGWSDACAVMIRKFVELLIIEVYERANRAKDIQDGDGNFRSLGGLIDVIVADGAWNLGRETKRGLPAMKTLGDRSAHGRRFGAKKEDINRVIPDLRVIADELIHLAALR